jgi:hypothetical protein
LAIELAQVVTRARSTDVDDVILNVFGAAIGFGIYRVAVRAASGNSWARELLSRLGSRSEREPLLAGLVPIAVTAAIAVPMMFSTLLSATIGEGPDGIEGYAAAEWPEASVVARSDVGEHVFVVVSDRDPEARRLRMVDFVRVMPGRYTWLGTSEMRVGGSSRFAWSLTAYNTERDQLPVVVVWGSNLDGAESMLVTGNGADERLALPVASQFVVGFPFDARAMEQGAVLEDFAFSFRDTAGVDVSDRFSIEGR